MGKVDINVLIGRGVYYASLQILIKNVFSNIHIGSLARINKSYNKDFDIAKINTTKDMIDKF